MSYGHTHSNRPTSPTRNLLGRPAEHASRPPVSGTEATSSESRQLGPYRICQELASGGMATVYLARLQGRGGIHRFVALKCLKPTLANDAQFVDMFLDEAEIVSRIHHPNVCSVLDYDRQGGVSYLAMEYLVGETLTLIRRQLEQTLSDWPVHQHMALAAHVVADACEGLHAAHELTDEDGRRLNVVHRDVSPENVMVTYDGTVKVLDFGVARASQQHHTTRAGDVKGKFSYLAPEILSGAVPDRRADVWALGVVLWELLTTQRLFRFETDAQTLQAVSSMRVRPPSRLRTGLPRELDDIVMKALDRDPGRRYQSARALGRDLRRLLARQRMAFGPAELAEAMARLFRDGRERKRGLLSDAAARCAREDVIQLETRDVAFLAPPLDEVLAASLRADLRTPAVPPPSGARPPAPAGRAWQIGFASAIATALLTWHLLASLGAPTATPARAAAMVTQAPGDSCLLAGPAWQEAPFTLRVAPLQNGSGAMLFQVSLAPLPGAAPAAMVESQPNDPVSTDPPH